jgi:hypothetical protein
MKAIIVGGGIGGLSVGCAAKGIRLDGRMIPRVLTVVPDDLRAARTLFTRFGRLSKESLGLKDCRYPLLRMG